MKEVNDKEGRFVIVKRKLENEMVTLVNVYDPPEKKHKTFFKYLSTVIATESEGIVLCGGDFNIILDHKIDTSTKRNKTHLAKFMNHPMERDYTHYSSLFKNRLCS